MNASRPTVLEWALAAFCASAGYFTIVLPGMRGWSGTYNPYALYYRDIGINLINLGGLAVDTLIVALVVGWIFSRRLAPYALRMVIVLAAIGAALTWAELWYGSTIYYGEVRDKQGLPLNVNNIGTIGSYAFLGYLICRLAPRVVRRPAVFAVIPLLLTASWFAHSAVLALLMEPWKLWQS